MEYPQLLIDIRSEFKKLSTPFALMFSDIEYPLEIQYFHDLANSENYDENSNHLIFATSTDGNQLVFDLNTKNLNILQNEFGDIDEIGISGEDILGSLVTGNHKEL